MAEGGVTKSSRKVNEYGLAFNKIREEEMEEEGQARKRQHPDKTNAFCDNCFLNSKHVITKIVAFNLCFVCDKYLCDKCFKGHESHKNVKLVSEESEKDEKIDSYLNEMMNESEREKKFERENVSMVDRVNAKHRLDRKDCRIFGLCGLGNTMWVVADYTNYCIKIFNVGSNLLQRYIRLGSRPEGVTEVKVKSKSSEQVVNTTGDLSVTNQTEPLLLAVTFPDKQLILIIDVTRSSAVITKTIKTKKECVSLDSTGGNLVTLCGDKLPDGGHRWFICVITMDGDIIQTINTDLHRWSNPHLSVSSERFYITDPGNHRVLCFDNEGNEVSHKIIGRSLLRGISVDPDTELVYTCGRQPDMVYRLNSSLESSEIILNCWPVNLITPFELCLHGDKLYVSQIPPRSTHCNLVSVVRVL